MGKLTIVNDALIPDRFQKQAMDLVAAIDIADAPFISLALFLKAFCWTGDKLLIKGLQSKGISIVLSTKEIEQLFL